MSVSNFLETAFDIDTDTITLINILEAWNLNLSYFVIYYWEKNF